MPMIAAALRTMIALGLVGTLSLVTSADAASLRSATRTNEDHAVTLAADEQPVSPAGCKIAYVSNPHVSDYFGKQGTRAIKVNVKSQCNSAVPELTLSVTLLNATTQTVITKTMKKASNKAYILNEDTYILCKNTDANTFQGTALGTSYEDGKIYEEIKFGNIVTEGCGF